MSDASGASMPTNTTNTMTTIPDYARPYVEEMLGGTSALTFQRDDKGGITGFQPYEAYGGERTAQFSPLQQQSYEAAGALGTSPQIYAASDMAQRAGLAALNQGSYTGGQFANQYQPVSSYTGDTGTYYRQNQDVADAYKQNSYGLTPEQFAQTHYQKYGMAEGREAPGTVGNQFQGSNTYNPTTATNQFAGNGAGQYNSSQFNARDTQVRGFADPAGAAQYFAQNPDVGAAYKANSFGMSPEQFAQAHYQQHGMAEGRDAYTTQSNAERLMSPYMQSVVDVQQREAQRQADIAGTRQQAAATQSGAFGGSRDAIMRAEAARNLALQKGDIQATGLQKAYEQAQAQFNADQNRSLQSQISNQGANLQAQGMGETSRQYGAGLGLQAAQANAQYGQAAQALNAQNQQFGAGQDLQYAGQRAQYGQAAQGLNAQNQQFGAQLGLNNAGNAAQYGQAAQQLGEQSRQYGAGLGIQGLQTALTGANTLGSLGAQQFQQDQGALQTQNTLGVQQQQQMQNILTQQYNDFLNQQKYPYQQMGYMSDMLRGLPMSNTSQQIYGQPQSATSQIAGLAATAYGASKLAKGGQVKAKPRAKGGLQELAMAKMMEAA